MASVYRIPTVKETSLGSTQFLLRIKTFGFRVCSSWPWGRSEGRESYCQLVSISQMQSIFFRLHKILGSLDVAIYYSCSTHV